MKTALILALAAGSLSAPTPTIKSRQFNIGDLIAPGSGGFLGDGPGSGSDLGDLFGGSSGSSSSSSPTPSSTADGSDDGFDLSDWFPGSSSAFKKLPRDGGLGGLGKLPGTDSSSGSGSGSDGGFDLGDLFGGSSGSSSGSAPSPSSTGLSGKSAPPNIQSNTYKMQAAVLTRPTPRLVAAASAASAGSWVQCLPQISESVADKCRRWLRQF